MFGKTEKPIERYQNFTKVEYKPLSRKEQLESIITGLHRYINSTEANPILDDHKHRVWYQGGNQPFEALAKLEAKLQSIVE